MKSVANRNLQGVPLDSDGAIVGAFAYRKLIGRHLPCDICVVEEKETTTPSEQKASL